MALREALDELREIAGRLNVESDRLNATIEDFEEELERIGAGVAVWLKEPLGQYDMVLGYKRIGERWRVAVCVTKDTVLDLSTAVPLTTAARGVRMLAVIRFEELTRAMTVQAKAHLQSIAEAQRS